MTTWEDRIIGRILPELSHLWVVADHDALIRNERIASRLIQNGFEILPFEDPLSFRYRFESGIRAAWDRGLAAKLIVVFDPDAQGFNRIPADVLTQAQRLELSLSDIFPHLNVTVLHELEPDLWAMIYEAEVSGPPTKSVRETQDIVLRTCFELDPTSIRSEAELLRILIRFHRCGRKLHATLAQYVQDVLSRKLEFRPWPLKELLAESSFLWRFFWR